MRQNGTIGKEMAGKGSVKPNSGLPFEDFDIARHRALFSGI
jgi:hypothetical protein